MRKTTTTSSFVMASSTTTPPWQSKYDPDPQSEEIIVLSRFNFSDELQYPIDFVGTILAQLAGLVIAANLVTRLFTPIGFVNEEGRQIKSFKYLPAYIMAKQLKTAKGIRPNDLVHQRCKHAGTIRHRVLARLMD